MEVHQHTHSSRKKWNHYLWEFLMLFLAVFCGFLAENFREHQLESQREKKYIISMVTDLAEDTSKLNKVIAGNINKFNYMDSLIKLLSNQQLSADDEQDLYEMYFQSVGIVPFISNDRTSRQLLNSGNMRLITRASVADSVIDYYGPNKELTQERIADITYFTYEANLFSQDIFDFNSVRQTLNQDSTVNYEFFPGKMKLITREKSVLRKYANKNAACKALVGGFIVHLIKMKKKAIALIAL